MESFIGKCVEVNVNDYQKDQESDMFSIIEAVAKLKVE